VTLIVIRHGRTVSNRRGLLLGRADPPLDELGIVQARALADAVGPVDRIVSSPLLRARQTAEAFGLPVDIDDRWIELDYGDFDGRPIAEIPAETWARWRADPDFAPPGGESLATLRRRVDGACDAIRAAAAEETVVVVTHVSPVKASVGWALDIDERVNWRTFVAPASITRITVDPGAASLVGFNEVAHLAEVEPSPSSDR
jgi:broad specificity phosphatase PhoE